MGQVIYNQKVSAPDPPNPPDYPIGVLGTTNCEEGTRDVLGDVRVRQREQGSRLDSGGLEQLRLAGLPGSQPANDVQAGPS